MEYPEYNMTAKEYWKYIETAETRRRVDVCPRKSLGLFACIREIKEPDGSWVIMDYSSTRTESEAQEILEYNNAFDHKFC